MARLESYTPPWPLPKIFRMTKGGKIVDGIFEGETINTPSMLAVEDYLDALTWAESVGGLKGLIARSNANLGVLDALGRRSAAGPVSWPRTQAIRSNTSVCLKITDPWFTALERRRQGRRRQEDRQRCWRRKASRYDIAGYRAAPPGLRIWCGATVDKADLEALTPWLDWAWAQVKTERLIRLSDRLRRTFPVPDEHGAFHAQGSDRRQAVARRRRHLQGARRRSRREDRP